MSSGQKRSGRAGGLPFCWHFGCFSPSWKHRQVTGNKIAVVRNKAASGLRWDHGGQVHPTESRGGPAWYRGGGHGWDQACLGCSRRRQRV